MSICHYNSYDIVMNLCFHPFTKLFIICTFNYFVKNIHNMLSSIIVRNVRINRATGLSLHIHCFNHDDCAHSVFYIHQSIF